MTKNLKLTAVIKNEQQPLDDVGLMRYEVMKLQAELYHCMLQPGAEITITVKHDSGSTATANLYDHAALVQSLMDTLDYFVSEL